MLAPHDLPHARLGVPQHERGVVAARRELRGARHGVRHGGAHPVDVPAEAAQEAQAAKEVADFMVDLFRQSNPNVQQRQNVTAQALLEQGIRRVSTDLSSQPLLQARLMQTMGAVQTALGKFTEARVLLEDVLRTREGDSETVRAASAVLAEIEARFRETEAVVTTLRIQEGAAGTR